MKQTATLILIISSGLFLALFTRCTEKEDTDEMEIFPPGRVFSEMVYDGTRKRVVLFGGLREEFAEVGNSNNLLLYLNDTWEYDGTVWSETISTVNPPTRYGAGMAFDQQRSVVVLYGGRDTSERSLDDLWEYTGTVWEKRAGFGDNYGDKPGRKAFPIMTYFPEEMSTVMMVGSQTDDMWFYDGQVWILTEIIVPTPIRFSFQARSVYDSNREKLILHSGRDLGYGDTYELQGNSWEPIASRHDPESRFSFGMIYDPNRDVLVLFGGQSCRKVQESDSQCQRIPLNDTWEFDGENWYVVEPRQSPPARYGHAMAYDESRGVTVLFGGMGENGTTLNDTWEYDGVTWTQR